MTKKPEIVTRNDLIKRKDNLMYKKYARVPFTGVYEWFHAISQLRFRVNYKDGEQHGSSESFYKNGQLHTKGNYKNGNADGIVEKY